MKSVEIYINGSAATSSLGNEISSTQQFQIENRDYHFIANEPVNETSRIFRLLSAVIEQLIDQLKLTTEQLAETCLLLGSSSMDIGEIKSDKNKTIWLNELDQINQNLINQFALNALNFTFNTACTSSANALIYATRLLRSGQIKRAIVIGCEFYNELTLSGFSSLELLSKQGLMAFSKQRTGMVLGEGVGALLLSTQIGAKDKLSIIDGYSSCDTYSLTTTEEDGSHIASVINQALTLAELNSEQIDLIKVHGTASPASDSAEAQALKNTFKKTPPIFALKPYIGHTLGACGALEIALLIELIEKDFIPAPAYARNIENCLLPFVTDQSSFSSFEHILINHCGFGGNNAALILKVIKSKPGTQF